MTRRLPEGAPILTAAAMRSAEDSAFAAGMTSDMLMARAADAIAVQAARLAIGWPMLVLAGPGKNGGDARLVAGLLRSRGHDVEIVASADMATAERRPVLIDGLLGIGLRRPLDADIADQFARLRADAFTIAIDVPSGFGIDDGADLGGAGADVTIALGALKPVHLIGAGAGASGHVLLADIDIDALSGWRTLARPHFSRPERTANKFTRGMAAVVGGRMPGAGRLAARAALAGGAGYVVLAAAWSPGLPDAIVQRPLDDALLHDARVGALMIGAGLGRDDNARSLLDKALASGRPLVIDGDALSLLGCDATTRLRDVDAVLTPHSGEFDRMFGPGDGDKITRTLDAARSCRCTIVHKGADTVVAHPDGQVTVASSGSPWLATAGSGDVLAGLVAARLAAGDATPAETALWLHTRAAALAGAGLSADALIDHITGALSSCL